MRTGVLRLSPCELVVAGGGSTQLAGTVLRSTICVLIQHSSLRRARGRPSQRNDYEQELYVAAVFERAYPRFPTVDELDVSETDRGCWLDRDRRHGQALIQDYWRRYNAPRVLRTLGLRHLVVDAGNKVQGIITRDLDHTHARRKIGVERERAENPRASGGSAPPTMARFSVAYA